MITENLSTLKIHKLTQEQYDRERDASRLDKTAFYLTPDEGVDFGNYATIEQLNSKSDTNHTHNDLEASISELESDVGDLSKLNTTTKDTIVDAINNCFQYASNGKKYIVDALTGKGINASTDLSFEELAMLITNEFMKSQNVTYIVDTNATYTESRLIDANVITPTTFTPSKSGYAFVGWREDTTADENVLEEKIMGDNPITLYAVFKKNITLSYNANGGSGYISTEKGARYYNNGNAVNPKFKLAENSFTNSGHNFSHWALGSTDGTQYAPGEIITLSRDMTFYAVWKALDKTYTGLIIKDYGNTLHGQDRQYPNHVYGIDESPESDKYAQFTIDLTGYSTMEVTIADFNSSEAVTYSNNRASRARLYFNDTMVVDASTKCNEDQNEPYSASIDISIYNGVYTVYSTYYNCDGDCEARDVTITFKV